MYIHVPVCIGGEIACSLSRRAFLVLDGRVPAIYNLFHFLLHHGRQPQGHGINLKKSRSWHKSDKGQGHLKYLQNILRQIKHLNLCGKSYSFPNLTPLIQLTLENTF